MRWGEAGLSTSKDASRREATHAVTRSAVSGWYGPVSWLNTEASKKTGTFRIPVEDTPDGCATGWATIRAVSPKTGRALRIAISMGLAVVLLILFLRNVDLAAVGHALRNARGGWLLTALGLALTAIPLRALRWMRLLRRIGNVKLSDSIAATCIGFAASILLPARAGEIVAPRRARPRRPPPLRPLAGVYRPRAAPRPRRRPRPLRRLRPRRLGRPSDLAPDEAGRLGCSGGPLPHRRSALVTVAGLGLLRRLAARPGLADRVLAGPLRHRLPDRFAAGRAIAVNSFLAGLGSIRTAAETSRSWPCPPS